MLIKKISLLFCYENVEKNICDKKCQEREDESVSSEYLIPTHTHMKTWLPAGGSLEESSVCSS